MQNIIDFILSLFSIIILSPLLIPICIILKLTGEGEIFYLQERVGKGGSHFKLIKFATMLKNSPNIGAGEITIKDDPRVLPFGKFLRKSKINELPQLINILFAQMSLVGPRPMVPNTYKKYPLSTQKKLNLIRPGLTGVGSIFFRDEESYLEGRDNPENFYEEEIIPYKCQLEEWYVENANMVVYLKCILLTAWTIVFPKIEIANKILKGIPKKPSNLYRT